MWCSEPRTALHPVSSWAKRNVWSEHLPSFWYQNDPSILLHVPPATIKDERIQLEYIGG
uniref:Uncharacterized protein n=1 Tax=Arundo donax TaxID=35708 RepID=A0A0A8ZHE6_ARUDO